MRLLSMGFQACLVDLYATVPAPSTKYLGVRDQVLHSWKNNYHFLVVRPPRIGWLSWLHQVAAHVTDASRTAMLTLIDH